MRHASSATLTSNGTPSQARHLRRETGFVYKISFSGSRSSCPSNQARRRFRTSGRSCSNACADFFKRPAAAPQPGTERASADTCLPLNRQTLDHFIERHVLPVVNHGDHKRLMCIKDRWPSPALWPGRRFTVTRSCDPPDRRRNPNPEPRRRLARRHARRRRF